MLRDVRHNAGSTGGPWMQTISALDNFVLSETASLRMLSMKQGRGDPDFVGHFQS